MRIMAFYGTSENAVITQVWVAIPVYVLVAIIKKELKIDHSLYTILQILCVTLFEKMPIYSCLETLYLRRGMLAQQNNCVYGVLNGTVVISNITTVPFKTPIN